MAGLSDADHRDRVRRTGGRERQPRTERSGVAGDNLVGSGVLAFGMMIRMLAVLIVLLVVVASDKDVGLAAALVYGLAYTAELGLSLAGYYSQEPTA